MRDVVVRILKQKKNIKIAAHHQAAIKSFNQFNLYLIFPVFPQDVKKLELFSRKDCQEKIYLQLESVFAIQQSRTLEVKMFDQ